MEVHHPKVEKKNFKEYFLEFLMLFLAVTMGFFAENIRENISDNERAKLLTEQLVKDLKVDTLNLQNAITYEQQQQKKIDTLFLELQQPIASANTTHIQQLVVNSYALKPFMPSNAAITAIKNALSIKQLAVSHLPVMITQYENDIINNKDEEDLLLKLLQQDLEPFMYKHFAASNANSVFTQNRPATNAAIRNLTQDNMTELSIQIELVNGIISSILGSDENLKDEAIKIMQFATKQYSLADE